MPVRTSAPEGPSQTTTARGSSACHRRWEVLKPTLHCSAPLGPAHRLRSAVVGAMRQRFTVDDEDRGGPRSAHRSSLSRRPAISGRSRIARRLRLSRSASHPSGWGLRVVVTRSGPSRERPASPEIVIGTISLPPRSRSAPRRYATFCWCRFTALFRRAASGTRHSLPWRRSATALFIASMSRFPSPPESAPGADQPVPAATIKSPTSPRNRETAWRP